jgi:hypothetical protein
MAGRFAFEPAEPELDGPHVVVDVPHDTAPSRDARHKPGPSFGDEELKHRPGPEFSASGAESRSGAAGQIGAAAGPHATLEDPVSPKPLQSRSHSGWYGAQETLELPRADAAHTASDGRVEFAGGSAPTERGGPTRAPAGDAKVVEPSAAAAIKSSTSLRNLGDNVRRVPLTADVRDTFKDGKSPYCSNMVRRRARSHCPCSSRAPRLQIVPGRAISAAAAAAAAAAGGPAGACV